jgi:hypothetical protein
MEKRTVNIKIGFDSKGEEIKNLLNTRETLKFTKNSTAECDKKLEEAFKDYFFSPVKRTRKEFLTAKTNKTEEELNELKTLIEEEMNIKENSVLKDFCKEFKSIFGNKALKIHKQYKANKYNGRIQYQEYTYLPSTLKSFIQNPGDELLINLSIFRIVLKNSYSAVNNQEIIEMVFVSLLYDEMTDEMVKHQWKVIATLEDSIVTDEDEIEAEELA